MNKITTVVLTAGHEINHGKGTGAHGLYGFDEAIEARQLVNDLSKHLRQTYQINAVTESDSLTLIETIKWQHEVEGPTTLAIDFHFNAGPSSATGSEVFIANKSINREKRIAALILEAIVHALGLRSRGVKVESQSPRKKLGILSNLLVDDSINILVETCFITNNSDIEIYRKNYPLLIASLAHAIFLIVHEE